LGLPTRASSFVGSERNKSAALALSLVGVPLKRAVFRAAEKKRTRRAPTNDLSKNLLRDPDPFCRSLIPPASLVSMDCGVNVVAEDVDRFRSVEKGQLWLKSFKYPVICKIPACLSSDRPIARNSRELDDKVDAIFALRSGRYLLLVGRS